MEVVDAVIRVIMYIFEVFSAIKDFSLPQMYKQLVIGNYHGGRQKVNGGRCFIIFFFLFKFPAERIHSTSSEPTEKKG